MHVVYTMYNWRILLKGYMQRVLYFVVGMSVCKEHPHIVIHITDMYEQGCIYFTRSCNATVPFLSKTHV